MGTLKARVGSTWVPVLGSGTDAAATARWNTAWGVVGSGIVTSTFTTTAPHTTSQSTGLSVTVTETAGRRLNIRVQTNPYPSGGIQAMQFALQRNGVTIDTWFVAGEAMAAGASLPMSHTVTVTATGGSVTYSVQVVAIGGFNTAVSDFGSAQAPRTIVVEDAGPVTPASIAPPTAGPQVVASGNALGIVAMGAMTNVGGQSVAANTPTDVTLPLTFTSTVGRRYRLVCRCRASNGGGSSLIRPLVDGNSMGDYYRWTSGSYDAQDVEAVFDGTGVTSVYKVQWVTTVAGAIWTESAYPIDHFYIEDVGPNTSPALPIPATPPAWTPLTYQSPWVFWSATRSSASYRKIGDRVDLRFQAAGGTPGTVMAYLPVGFRPPAIQDFVGRDSTSGVAVFNVNPDGAIVWYASVGGGTWCALNCSFSTTP